MSSSVAASEAPQRPRPAVRNNVTVGGRPDGPVMLFAHGFGCDQDMWSRLVPHFTDTHRVVLVDHVGSGGSDPGSYDPVTYSSVEGYAADLVEVCHDLGLTEVTLVAHSVASMMAVVAAVAEPSLFSTLVLVAPSPCYLDDPATGYVGGFSAGDVDELLASLDSNHHAWAAAMAPVVMGTPEQPELGAELTARFCATDPTVAREFARVTFLSDVRALVPRVTTPTLVLQCSQDLLAPVEVGSWLRDALPDGRLVHLEATGHCPHVSAPAETAAAVRAHLGSGG